DEQSPYRRKLEGQLQQPETCLAAALRLEAIGRDSVGVLKDAMKNSPYPLVRFAAAESLAYLGEPIAALELSQLAEEHPTLQTYSLAALSSIDDSASSLKLQELLASEVPEVRNGAFRALREVDPQSPAARGYRMNQSFWLHLVAPQSKPL